MYKNIFERLISNTSLRYIISYVLKKCTIKFLSINIHFAKRLLFLLLLLVSGNSIVCIVFHNLLTTAKENKIGNLHYFLTSTNERYNMLEANVLKYRNENSLNHLIPSTFVCTDVLIPMNHFRNQFKKK